MRFILKLMMWSFVALVILPSVAPVESHQSKTDTAAERPQLSSTDAVSLAVGIANDVRGLCVREPALCEIGQQAIMVAIERARDGAVIVGAMVEEHRAKQADASLLTTGSIR
ncbi:MAG: DUF5330 domain-containing protein [Ahrensia sp.]|nr:DUF5330 domain-containing protein [Ahrensia sp.]